MIKKALTVWLLLLALPAFCQRENDYVARLPVVGGFSELGVSPTEELWVATKAGHIYYTKRVEAPWDVAYPNGPSELDSWLGETYERVTCFSDSVLIVSGFIQDEGEQNFVYRSSDHGASWRKVRFGPSSWIDACYASATGKAWMSGSSQLVYYTEDSGRTWRHFPKVEKTGNLRFSAIHFAPDEKTGLFGSLQNKLYRTRDNCRSWEKLPTPLSQNKYRPISKARRPDITKVRIAGDHYLVNQEGKVFLTRASAMDWQRLPDVVDFEVSESGQVYTVHQDRTVTLHDSHFRPLWRSTRHLDYPLQALAVRNEKLFAVTPDSAYRIGPGQFVATALLTHKVNIPEPYATVRYHGTAYGVAGKDILRYNATKKQWARFITTNFPLGNATVFNDQLLVSNGLFDQHFAVNEALKRLDTIRLPAQLLSLRTPQIATFHLETGSQGCFHTDNNRRSYTRKGDEFELLKTEKPTAFLTSMAPRIAAARVEALVNELDRSRTQAVTFADLDISPRDVAQFQDFIAKAADKIKKQGPGPPGDETLYQFPGENTDFSFYQQTASTLATLPTKQLNDAFWHAYGSWSTTMTWRRIIFVFEDGKRLVVENADDMPNYLYAPWTIAYDGLTLRSNSLRFGQLVDELTKRQFFPDVVRDKNYAIFTIVNYLYRQKLHTEE